MKKIILVLMLVSFNCHAEVTTITKTDLVGDWVSFFGFGIKPSKKAIENKLYIKSDYSIRFQRYFPNGKVEKYIAKKEVLKYVGDVFIIQFHKNKQLAYKLVMSGWKDEKYKLIFGTLYLYNHDQIFNGMSVSLKQVPANNAAGLDSQKSDCISP